MIFEGKKLIYRGRAHESWFRDLQKFDELISPLIDFSTEGKQDAWVWRSFTTPVHDKINISIFLDCRVLWGADEATLITDKLFAECWQLYSIENLTHRIERKNQ